ncbi:MAG: hypothetical protein II135_11205 [Clostridia bacterium]|nr:hypothetical protein [Clostridia bacterium]
MQRRRILSILLLITAVLPALVSCSRIRELRRKTPETLKYVNEDYHFSLTRPSSFSEIVETPSEENNDEYLIELKNSDGKVISVEIVYKPTENIYEYAELYCPEKNRITALSSNHFAYDQRECPSYRKPAYYIYANTKRMLYIIKYEFEHGDKEADKVVDSLKFEFDIYANLPKENAFLSPAFLFAASRMSVKIPADATVRFYPDPDSVPAVYVDEETGKVIRPNVGNKSRIFAFSNKYFYSAAMPAARFTPEQLASDDTDGAVTDLITELSEGKAVNVKIAAKGERKENSLTKYRIINFTCLYNGSPSAGSVTVGYTSFGRYFEYIYASTEDMDEAGFNNYNDMIHSIYVY